MVAIPKRYEPRVRLGEGGGGEVWAVRDRVSEEQLALKVLAPDAGEREALALVREAIALSGLEGLGVPRVLAFGALPDGRRFMVRELVEGESLEALLEKPDGGDFLTPLVRVSEQLTALHRAGLLHGDIKPANVIVGPGGRGTLVDLGLAAPWREGGTTPQGLTPKYAAPELFMGAPLTVRGEVYAVGATLADALARRGRELDPRVRRELSRIAARAMERMADLRYPSVDELASAMCQAAGIRATPPVPNEAAWPVLGVDAAAQDLLAAVRALPRGGALAVVGPRGSGRSTLLRRVAWTLGVEGRAVATLERPRGSLTFREAVELELEAWSGTDDASELTLVVDDASIADPDAREAIVRLVSRGARVVAAEGFAIVSELASAGASEARVFEVPPLEASVAEELVQRAMPSLPDALRAHLLERSGRRPGLLRAMTRKLAGRAVVSPEDVDAALDGPSGSLLPPAEERLPPIERAERQLDRGRFDDAAVLLEALETPTGRANEAGVRLAIARARVALGRGAADQAVSGLDAVKPLALAGPLARSWLLYRARAAVRAGDYAKADVLASEAVSERGDDALAADALAVRGVALAFRGEENGAMTVLARSVELARASGDRRVEGLALASLAIAHQRAGRASEARAAFEQSLSASEDARDAGSIANTRVNLAILAQGEGDFAAALRHLEAGVDMGRRAGGLVAVQQALLNLANLDLYLGRYARASASLDSLASARDALGPTARAQLLGLEAELATRTGDVARGARLYDACGDAWQAQGRAPDAAEARLEALLARTRESAADPRALSQRFGEVQRGLGEGGFGEHGALAAIVRGSIASLAGDEAAARAAFDEGLELAEAAGRREWAIRALDARARLLASQGSFIGARRDTDAALAMLEATAAKLPRDLREVFWDDPRRRALRQAHSATVPAAALGVPSLRTSSVSIIGMRPADDRLSRILEITRELVREHDISELLTRVTDHAVALLGGERGFVVLVSEDGALEVHTARTRAGADDPHAQFSRSVAEKVIETGEPVVTTSARDDERLARAVSIHQLMIQSVACVPIRGPLPAGKTIGALYVETRLRVGERFEDELPTLSAFADQAALAIENARLIQENRARAEALARANLELERANAELASARDRLAETLDRRTEQLAATRRDLKQARAELRSHFGYAGLVGTSSAMRKVYAIIDRVKDADVPVLVTGESGTGKEMVAKAIHASSPRAKRPFVGVNCGAIPANLLESELFGHVRGAFTGADRERKGLFRECEGGTLLLDEIGEMPHKMQAGLLRVLQERSVRPVGGTHETKVDVRVIAATNRDLAQMVEEGTFREDLYYRLHVVEVRVPALRERADDVPALVDHFLSLFAARHRRERKTVSRDAMRRLSAYTWPGNVRQLEHVLLNAWLMSDEDEIAEDELELPDGVSRLRSVEPEAAEEAITGPRPTTKGLAASHAAYKASERERILSALTACNWNRVQAAKMVGLPRRTFYRRLKEFGIL
jgi:transcriptional regulator with GAF, ATPase, and Fis domain